MRLRLQPAFVNLELFSIAQDDRSLNHVLQLANVAGPVVPLKEFQRFLPDMPDSFSRFLCVALDQVLDEQRNVIHPIPRRRDLYGKDIQAIVQILAKRTSCDGRLQIPVRSRHHAPESSSKTS